MPTHDTDHDQHDTQTDTGTGTDVGAVREFPPPWHDVRVGRWPFAHTTRVRGHDPAEAVDNARFLSGREDVRHLAGPHPRDRSRAVPPAGLHPHHLTDDHDDDQDDDHGPGRHVLGDTDRDSFRDGDADGDGS